MAAARTHGTIKTLTDNRLVKINPQAEGFFDAVLNFRTSNENINLFIEAVEEVKAAYLEAFYTPIYDPSEGSGEIPVIYEKSNNPAVGHSYNWWAAAASKMPAVEGRMWDVASEYQRYAFLVDVVNKKVKSGESLADALDQVVNDSTELGHYYNAKNSTKGQGFEPTGSRCVCGFYDLANTYKILKCSNPKAGGFWVAGGNCNFNGGHYPLADLSHYTDVDNDDIKGVAMLVISVALPTE